MVLYHGSKDDCGISGNKESTVSTKIFILGFIARRLPEQAERWATRYGTSGYVNCYEYTPDNKLKYLVFDEMTEEWLGFYCCIAEAENLMTFDIVEGPMADDTIYNYVQNYIDGKISRAAFLGTGKIQSSDTSD